MPIQQLERRDVRPTPIEVGIKPLQGLTGPSLIESQRPINAPERNLVTGILNIVERLAVLPSSVSPDGPVRNACYRAQVVKGHTERIHHGSGRSRGSCGACEAGQEGGHNGGRQCRRRGMLRSNLKLQQSSINNSINKLPSKSSVFY